MSPENIVDTAVRKGLSIIAITDNNEILNVKIAIKHSEGNPVLVIPVIEVSTTQGNLLVYFETYNDLQNFHGKLKSENARFFCHITKMKSAMLKYYMIQNSYFCFKKITLY